MKVWQESFVHLTGILEAGAGWIGSFLDQADAVVETPSGLMAGLKRRPTEYFREQCFISGDPDETAVSYVIDPIGADCFMWATDYPHPHHPETWALSLENNRGRPDLDSGELP